MAVEAPGIEISTEYQCLDSSPNFSDNKLRQSSYEVFGGWWVPSTVNIDGINISDPPTKSQDRVCWSEVIMSMLHVQSRTSNMSKVGRPTLAK